MAISVSVSDQVQDGYLAAGRGIAQGIQAFAQNRINSLEALSRSPDPAIAGPATEKLKRKAGISNREEREFLTRSMDGLAQMGAVTIEDLEKFNDINLQGQRAMFAQKFTLADLGMRETALRKEMDLELEQKGRMLDLELRHKEAAYRANEESQGRIGAEADQRQRRDAQRALKEDRKAVQMLIEEASAQARKEGVVLDPFDVSRAKRMPPEQADEFLFRKLEKARQEKEGASADKIPLIEDFPELGFRIVRDRLNPEKLIPPGSIHPYPPADGTTPASPGAPAPTRPPGAKDLILRGRG